jgi:hypothetical protein
MWRKLLQGTEWSMLRDLASPAFFRVIEPGALARQVRELSLNAARRQRYAEIRDALCQSVARSGIRVRLGWAPDTGSIPNHDRGTILLRLFFHQLFECDAALLDLRYARFAAHNETLVWDPQRLWIRWDADFLPRLRALYTSFYGGETADFRSALDALGIGCLRETFSASFGGGRQAASTFSLRDFQRSFHETFMCCREAGATLHPNFLGLGISLACLYEHLERLGGSYNVTDAFRASRSDRPQSP